MRQVSHLAATAGNRVYSSEYIVSPDRALFGLFAAPPPVPLQHTTAVLRSYVRCSVLVEPRTCSHRGRRGGWSTFDATDGRSSGTAGLVQSTEYVRALPAHAVRNITHTVRYTTMGARSLELEGPWPSMCCWPASVSC